MKPESTVWVWTCKACDTVWGTHGSISPGPKCKECEARFKAGPPYKLPEPWVDRVDPSGAPLTLEAIENAAKQAGPPLAAATVIDENGDTVPYIPHVITDNHEPLGWRKP